jgi:hypothetical protein
MSPARLACSLLVLLALNCIAAAGDGNRLTYLDGFCDPYYVGLDTPKLITPQWVGQPGVEAVIVLATDDLREPARHEAFLRPILERLKKIDGRAPVSLMANQTDPKHPQLQQWLAAGASLEAHTWDHPCPLLQGGDLAAAKATYDRAVDLMAGVANNRPVAFRVPCCDSMSAVSPRFFAEIFNQTTPKGNFLALDSSVFLLLTANDPALPRRLVLDADGPQTVQSGQRIVKKPEPKPIHYPLSTVHSPGRFRKYVPADKVMANLIEDYPYPYVIGPLC